MIRGRGPVHTVHSENERRMRAMAEALSIRRRGAAIAYRTALIWTREDLASGETALSMMADMQASRNRAPPGLRRP